MIALSFANGQPIRILNASSNEGWFGFHSRFGFLNREAWNSRVHARKAKGLSVAGEWLAEFRRDNGEWVAISGCEIQAKSEKTWELLTDFGNFILQEVEGALTAGSIQGRGIITAINSKNRNLEKSFGLALVALAVLYFLLPKTPTEVIAPVVMEPVEVKMVQEAQHSVSVAETNAIPQKLVKDANAKAKVAVAQNLGFLALVGRKDLTKALGGLQTVPGASAGAGAGGHEGSGGELLVGLGNGVQRTTIGNSGVAGLGGIGTKGAGGGAGGYGNSLVGSGNGRALSSIPLSEDLVLDGGLDRSVIQATIAKYLNQVRACYEDGLRKSPGLVGQVTMAFVIAGSGSVSTAQVNKSSLGNSEVEQCISQKMLTWIFPKPRGGVSVKVHYPFLLRPVDS